MATKLTVINKYIWYLKVVDFIPIARYQNVETMKLMELVTPIWIDHSILLQPFPDEESHLDVTIKTFELPVKL